jgi:hypothetical protein
MMLLYLLQGGTPGLVGTGDHHRCPHFLLCLIHNIALPFLRKNILAEKLRIDQKVFLMNMMSGTITSHLVIGTASFKSSV